MIKYWVIISTEAHHGDGVQTNIKDQNHQEDIIRWGGCREIGVQEG